MFCIDARGRLLVLVIVAAVAGCAGLTPAPRVKPEVPAASSVAAPPAVDAHWRQAYEQALRALQTGRFADAERALKALSEREPNLAGPHANLGIAYQRMGRAADAARELERAIELNARPAYYNELGVVHRTEGRFDAAEQAYIQALVLDPDYAYAHLNIGILYDLYMQKPDKALPHYERYQALAPKEAGTIGKWIVDLKRRPNQAAEHVGGGKSG